ncbi:MAG: cysteine hydrolase family protein [Lachnospiraceae bacterium]|nr:cysteine hydrolase family protein [Lachnospiraceae bacterium]
MILLVVDTQKGITDNRLFEFDKVKYNIKLLIRTARQNGVEVIYVQHDDGPGTGFSKGDEAYEIYEEFEPKVNEKIFCKTVNSSFHKSTGLLAYLQEREEKQILIVGLQTDFCIDATIKSGFEHGFEMVVPEYANSTFDNKYFSREVAYNYYNNLMWPKRYAKCVTLEDALEMLIDK